MKYFIVLLLIGCGSSAKPAVDLVDGACSIINMTSCGNACMPKTGICCSRTFGFWYKGPIPYNAVDDGQGNVVECIN